MEKLARPVRQRDWPRCEVQNAAAVLRHVMERLAHSCMYIALAQGLPKPLTCACTTTCTTPTRTRWGGGGCIHAATAATAYSAFECRAECRRGPNKGGGKEAALV